MRVETSEQGWLHPATGFPEHALWKGLRLAASLNVTLAVLALVGASVVWTYLLAGQTVWPMASSLALCSVNLVAAIAVHPAFRRHTALLAFHLALLAVIVLVAIGRLTHLKGRVELTSGEAFSGDLTEFEAGPWHGLGYRGVRFVNEGFSIDYLPGRMRDHTRNRVAYPDADGRRREVVIGDQVPLVLDGYRFYTSFNKGFALKFQWEPNGGAPVRGAVHLPAYPLHEYRQANTWTPPGAAQEVWVQLQFDTPLLDPGQPGRFALPESHVVVARIGERRQVLKPGAALELDGGRAVYEGLGTWMGYTVFYDWTIPWLLAACAVAVASMIWHLARKLFDRSWWSGATGEREEAA